MSSTLSKSTAYSNHNSKRERVTSRKKNLNKQPMRPKALYNLLQRNSVLANGVCASFFPIALHRFQRRKGDGDHEHVAFVVHDGSHRKDTRNRHALGGICHRGDKRPDDLPIAVHQLAVFARHERHTPDPPPEQGEIIHHNHVEETQGSQFLHGGEVEQSTIDRTKSEHFMNISLPLSNCPVSMWITTAGMSLLIHSRR